MYTVGDVYFKSRIAIIIIVLYVFIYFFFCFNSASTAAFIFTTVVRQLVGCCGFSLDLRSPPIVFYNVRGNRLKGCEDNPFRG